MLVLLVSAGAAAQAVTVGYVSIHTDSLPDEVFLDATAVHMTQAPKVMEATPGKHFISLFPPRKVYLAAAEQAPEHFWEKLRQLGAIGDQYELMSSYEAGAVKVGTSFIYVQPDETVSVRLSHKEVLKTYRRDSGCVMRTFFGWTLLIGASMVAAIMLSHVNAD
jgi:hypothetical protein